jgi:hypothetical protein
MEPTHRYRILIYFAAMVLCLSVCFAFAEDIPTEHAAQAAHANVIFENSQVHASFMPPLRQSFLPTTSEPIEEPVVSPEVLRQLTRNAQRSHRLLHGLPFLKQKSSLIVVHSQPVPENVQQSADAAFSKAGQSE